MIKTQYPGLTYTVGTGSCRPMKKIFDSVIWSWYTSLNIKLGANRTFHVSNIPVYRFGLYGRYQVLLIDTAHFQYLWTMANRSLFAKLEVRSSLRSDAIVITTNGRTDRQT